MTAPARLYQRPSGPPSYWTEYWYFRYRDPWYRWGVSVFWRWRPHPKDSREFWHREGQGYYWRSRRGGDGGGRGGDDN
ncbi:hypothetical protein JCM8097_001314 [Rhodosporidiobolus ruineniae]